MVITYNGRTITLPPLLDIALRGVEVVGKVVLLIGVAILIAVKMLIDLVLD